MGDGDEVIDLSPSFFLCFECPRAWRPLFPAACSLPALCPSGVVGSPRFACRPSGRVAGRGLSCRRAVRCGVACRSSLVHRVGRRNGGVAGCLLCVPRLVAQCGRRGVCPAWLVPVNRCGRRDGVACRPLLAWMRLAGEYVDYVECPFLG